MTERARIYISAHADRTAVASVLVRNGYTVREGKEKRGNKYDWFVEYWRDGV